MRIHRSHPDKNFSIVPNELAQDLRLSLTARGLLLELFSRPDGWNTNADSMSRQAKNFRSKTRAEGRRAMRAAFAELEEFGYLVRTKIQDPEDGRFVTTMDVYDTPGHAAPVNLKVVTNEPARGTGSVTSETVTSGTVTSETGTSLQSTDQQSTYLESTDQQHSATFADANVGAARAAPDDLRTWQLARYKDVDRLSDGELDRALLKFERERNRIYGECRDEAMKQLKGEAPQVLDDPGGPDAMRRLTLKYGIRHYSHSWPVWFERVIYGKTKHERQHRSQRLAS